MCGNVVPVLVSMVTNKCTASFLFFGINRQAIEVAVHFLCDRICERATVMGNFCVFRANVVDGDHFYLCRVAIHDLCPYRCDLHDHDHVHVNDYGPASCQDPIRGRVSPLAAAKQMKT